MNSLLPVNWQTEILAISGSGIAKNLRPTSVTSREENVNDKILVITVGGGAVRERLPWLYDLYHGLFLSLAQVGSTEPVAAAKNDLYGAVLNVQRGTAMRYECHVDSNPIEGLLYVTSHPPGTGGELAVANQIGAKNVRQVDADCSLVFPVAGNLIFFDARRFAHYVRPLRSETSTRVVVAMNYYVPSCSEDDRPSDLSRHLFGDRI